MGVCLQCFTPSKKGRANDTMIGYNDVLLIVRQPVCVYRFCRQLPYAHTLDTHTLNMACWINSLNCLTLGSISHA